jgi:hypothetical protein
MKIFLVALLFVSLVASVAQTKTPRLATVTPETGKPAAEFTAAGENLSKAGVKELFLTNGKDDIKVEILAQKEEAIQFKVPGSTKPGRYALMILTGDGKQLLEQPAKVTIE